MTTEPSGPGAMSARGTNSMCVVPGEVATTVIHGVRVFTPSVCTCHAGMRNSRA